MKDELDFKIYDNKREISPFPGRPPSSNLNTRLKSQDDKEPASIAVARERSPFTNRLLASRYTVYWGKNETSTEDRGKMKDEKRNNRSKRE